MSETDTELTGEDLDERARELKIKGRSQMGADELRKAVSEAEANLAETNPTAEQAGAGPVVPPDPPAPTDGDAEGADSPSSEPLPKDALIARADRLLGVSPALARGVLAEADDHITIDAAKRRIQDYLDGAVANTEEA